MPAGLGDIMVVVRAQDFASRTLRRVSGELAGLSRQQAIAYQGQMVQYQKGNALARQAIAQSEARRLSYIGEARQLDAQVQAMQRFQRAQTALYARGKGGQFGAVPSTAPLKDLQKEYLAAQAGMQKFGLSTRNVAGQLAPLEQRLGKMTERINTFSPALQRAYRNQGVFANALYNSRMRLAQAAQALNDAQIAELQFNAAVRAAPVNRLHDIAGALSGVGRTMQLWGAVGTGIFVLTSNAAASFSRQITLAATQTRKAGQSFVVTARNADVLQEAVLQMMTQFPASAADMSQAAYDIYSSIDVSFGNGIKLLRMFNKVAVAGQVDLATATKAGVAVLSNFDKQLTDHNKITSTTSRLMNLMFATVRYGFMTFQDYATMLVSVIPAATNAQQKMEDVAGAMAMATRIMPASASRAATALSRLLDVFTWPDFQAGMAKLGVSITYLDQTGKRHLLPFMEIMERLNYVVKTGRVPLNRIIQLITQVGRGQGMGREATMQARRLLGPMIDQMETLRRVQREVVGDTNEFNQAYKAMANTLGVRWQVMLNQYKVLILTIGEQALPVMIKIGDYIGTWIDKWRKLDEHTRGMIVRWTAIASVFTLIAGVVLSVIGVFTSLAANILSLGIKLGVAQETGEGLLPRLTTMLTTLRGIAGIGAIAIGISLMLNKSGIDPWVGALLTGVGAKLLSGRAGVGLGVGTIAIGIELFRMGGNWQYLGELLAVAGVVGMAKGFTAGVTAATVTVGVQLLMKGGGWNTVIGSALLAIGAGAMTGQPIVVPVVFVASITFSWINEDEQKRKVRQSAIDSLTAYKQELEGLRAAGAKVPDYLFEGIDTAMKGRPWGKWMTAFQAISPFQTNRKWDQDAVDSATRQAKKYINAWNAEMKGSQWWKNLQDAPINRAYRGLGDYKPPNLKKPLDDAAPSAATLVRASKAYTLNMAAVKDLMDKINNAYKQTASSAEVAVVKIASAMSNNKIQIALKLIDQFIATSNKKVDWSNIGKEIQNAVNSGDIQGAAQILSQFVQDTNQAREQYANDMKQWTADMKRWNDDLQNTMKDAASTTMNTLRGLYQQITQQNETLMGDLFKGPWLTSQTFDLAKEWGITPRVQDMIRDMKEQVGQFDQIRNLYSTALGKKLPKGFLDEIMKMAPDQALQFLTSLSKASPAEIQQIITYWNKRKAAIKKASKMDFTDSINAYRKAGMNMATAMLNGFDSIDLDKQFSTWIKKQFPNLIDAAVNQAVAKWKKENPVPTKPTGVAGGGGEAPTAPPPQGGKAQPPPGRSQMPMGDTSNVQAPKIPPPNVDYAAYKKAGVAMGNNIVIGFHSAHVMRRIRPDFQAQIPVYRNGGYRLGVAMANGVVNGFMSQNVQDQIASGFSQSAKMFTVGAPEGLLKPGNLDLLHRKAVQVGKAFATVRSISIGVGKNTVLIPTIVGGKQLNTKQAIAHYQKTGENLGTFASVAAADAYANTLHNQQANMLKAGGDVFTVLGREYNAAGRRLGTALNKGVIVAWDKRIPDIKKAVDLNWNESIIAYNSAGRRLGNAMILGFKQAKVGHYFRTWINETFPKLIDAAVTEAVTKWKKEHKNEVKPGKAGGTTNNTTNNTSTDNRIIITVPDSVGPHVKTNARYVAWLAKHHIRPNQVQNV